MKKLFFVCLICPFFCFSSGYAQQSALCRMIEAYCMQTAFQKLPSQPDIHSLTSNLLQDWQAYRATEAPDFDFEKLLLALVFATEKHDGQTQKDTEGTPYILHPLRVCKNLWDIAEVRSSTILMAALLQNTLAATEEIEKYFGAEVSQIVKESSMLPMADCPPISHEARLVKLADHLTNVLTLQSAARAVDEKPSDLLTAFKGTHPKLESALQRELETLLCKG